MPNLASNTMIEPANAFALIAAKNPVQGNVTLTPLAEGLVAHILGRDTSAAALSHLQQQGKKRGLSLRETSPDQWFLIGDKPYSAVEFAELVQDLHPDFMISDQSSGRVRLQIEGEQAPHILNKGIALDFKLEAFPIGKSTPTLCGHIGVHLTRQGEHVFECMVLRSFAVDFWEQLAIMCAPHK